MPAEQQAPYKAPRLVRLEARRLRDRSRALRCEARALRHASARIREQARWPNSETANRIFLTGLEPLAQQAAAIETRQHQAARLLEQATTRS